MFTKDLSFICPFTNIETCTNQLACFSISCKYTKNIKLKWNIDKKLVQVIFLIAAFQSYLIVNFCAKPMCCYDLGHVGTNTFHVCRRNSHRRLDSKKEVFSSYRILFLQCSYNDKILWCFGELFLLFLFYFWVVCGGSRTAEPHI